MAKQNDLFSLMLNAPWHVYAFRSGAATGSSNRRNNMAAVAAHKNQRNNISNNTPPHLPSGRTSSDLTKTNRMVADKLALRSY